MRQITKDIQITLDGQQVGLSVLRWVSYHKERFMDITSAIFAKKPPG